MFRGGVPLSLLQKGNKSQRLLSQEVNRVTCGDAVSPGLAEGLQVRSCDSNGVHTTDIPPGFAAL